MSWWTGSVGLLSDMRRTVVSYVLFAVALHAARRAGSLAGKRVLVTGGGPIGLLAAMTARLFGATPVVLTDVTPARREKARQLGVDAALDPAAADFRDTVNALVDDGFDIVFEASGARAAVRQAFDVVRPGGTIVQIGTLGAADLPLPANSLMVREINYVGSMRYENVFPEAIRLLATRGIALRRLISDVLPLAQAKDAMHIAGDRGTALKVHLTID